MESKIPKRPGSAMKTVIPTERIKSNSNAPLSKFSALSEPYRDLTNLRLLNGRLGRAASPDMTVHRSQAQTHTRTKMRRSRSACDLGPHRKADNVVPAKLPRLNEGSVCNNSSLRRPGLVSTKAPVLPKSNLSNRNAPINKVNAPIKKAGNASTSSKAASSALSSSTTGAAKPINKRIPPYDFKARYNDLLEKFKSLKEKFEQKNEALNNLENLSEQFEELQTDLKTTKEELQKKVVENENFRTQIDSYSSKLESLTKNFIETKKELDTLREKHQIISTENNQLSVELTNVKESNIQLSAHNENLEEELKSCRDQLFRFNVERKELHNNLMDLRGNIRVFCRVRPALMCEQDKPQCGWNYIDEATVEIQNHDLLRKNKPGAHSFNFDYVFHPGSRQEDIFEMVSPLIQSAMDGYNVCIFAYGQTGSGKTYTMDGIESNVGVIPRTVDLIFESVEKYKCLGWEYTLKATFLEIYNEVLYDLLSNEPKDMEIRMAKNNKNEIYVSNITEETVSCADHLRELLEISKMNRATAATIGNERSSRSHAVTRIQLIGYHEKKNEYSIGTVNLVDLAGSESPKTSIRMNETKSINRSLSELTNVILALLQKQDHIPYRNSKLTHLLMPALGGNSKTLMFINVAPFLDCYVESVKSLRFAASVNSCKVSKAKRNRYLNTSSSGGLLDK